jgi:hypothetical protein
VGIDGGSVAVASGETVTFAPGTFTGSTAVTLKVYDGLDVPAPPAGVALLGHAIDLEPSGVTFDPPAVITLPYSDTDLGGADPSTLAIWVYLNGAWQSLGGSVDPVHHTVSISVAHFTLYAVMTPRTATAPALPGTGSGGAGRSNAHDVLAWMAVLTGVAGLLSLAAGMGRRTD